MNNEAKSASTLNSDLLKLVSAFVFIAIVMSLTNYLARQTLNQENEYSEMYKQKLDKGYLTEEDIQSLKDLEEEYLSDESRFANDVW